MDSARCGGIVYRGSASPALGVKRAIIFWLAVKRTLTIETVTAAVILAAVILFGRHVSADDLPVRPVKFGDTKDQDSASSPPQEALPGAADPRDATPPIFYGEEIDAEESSICYVLDISGSMMTDFQPLAEAWDGWAPEGARWHRAFLELQKSIQGLAENFRFSVVLFDCRCQAWRLECMQATDEAKKAALAWVKARPPNGGATGTGPCTAFALAIKASAYVLLTDGAPNCGADGLEGHRRLIARNNHARSPIHVFGVAAHGDYRAWCVSVAADSGGLYVDVP